MNDIDNRII